MNDIIGVLVLDLWRAADYWHGENDWSLWQFDPWGVLRIGGGLLIVVLLLIVVGLPIYVSVSLAATLSSGFGRLGLEFRGVFTTGCHILLEVTLPDECFDLIA